MTWKRTEIKPVNSKGNQSWIVIGRTDAETETPIFWPPDVKIWFISLMLGNTEGGGKRGQQRMRWLDGITDSMDMSLTPGIGDGQGGLECCNPWVCKESDMTERLNWTDSSKMSGSMNDTALSAKSMYYSKSFVVISTIFTFLPGVDSFAHSLLIH